MQHRRINPHSAASQRGAVLYVALIMLILMALIGIVGMQVAGLQEKMSANYRNVNLAFQNSEGSARMTECYIEAQVNRTASACTAAPIEQICDTGFDATNWAKQRAMDDAAADRVLVRSIGQCISGGASLGMGREAEKGGDPNPIYQVTTYATDFASNPTADAAIDTIFSP
ncbi:pilus assembly protein [Pseudoxanthomonas gei]|uniref:Pilus assembly protein n=2 Tax=Pseudoxanthomonas gei TaxID=1383030 RepID=A0ABX0AGI9_9GAMM|nr:pilus assembly protein [Pseudoxanthomonas gei]